MSSLTLPAIPRSSIYAEGIMTLEWQDFFRDLYVRVGKNKASTTNELEDSGAVLDGRVTTSEGDITSIEGRVTNLEGLPKAWPIGSVFTSIVNTNPNTLLGYGVWVAFGAGRVLVGFDTGDWNFDEAEETGGAKTHDHPATNSGSPSATMPVDNNLDLSAVFVGSGLHTHSTNLAMINHMPPYIVVYFWKRTA